MRHRPAGTKTRTRACTLALLSIVGCDTSSPPDESGRSPASVDSPAPQVVIKTPPALLRAVTNGERRRVLVVLDEDTMLERHGITQVEAAGAPGLEIRRTLYEATAFDLQQATQGLGVESKDSPRYAPVLVYELDSRAALEAIADNPTTSWIVPDEPLGMFAKDNLTLIAQPTVAAAGLDGRGTSVAVLDTGVDYSLPAFGSCSTPGASGCKVAYARDFATEDGARDAHGHGTNVAGIVLDVAPAASIIGLDVFDGGSAWSSTILQAIDWVIQNRVTYNIAAINMSLGGGSFTSPCASDVFASAIANARAAGIVSVVASGNNGYTNALASPACAPAAVSVGAVYPRAGAGVGYGFCSDATTSVDKVTCFSNSASFLSVLAPGAGIEAAGITMSGTSQAAPHVAGQVALLRSAFPQESTESLIARITTTGKAVTDTKNGVTKRRIDLVQASGACGVNVSSNAVSVSDTVGQINLQVTTANDCAWTVSIGSSWIRPALTSGTGSATLSIAYEALPSNVNERVGTLSVNGTTVTVTQGRPPTAPVPTIAINAGATATRSRSVVLTLGADKAVTSMCLSNTTTCSTWEPYAAQKSWQLTAGDGAKSVSVWLKDSGARIGGPKPASIALDTVVPVNGKLSAATRDATVDLSWTEAQDATSGVDSYVVVGAATRAPTSCTGTSLYRGAARTFSHTGLTNGATYGYRVCAIDRAGNMSAGVTVTASPRPEFDGPTATVLIEGGAPVTNKTTATLTIIARDASGLSKMCLSATTTCTAFQAFAATKSWPLSKEGINTVNAWFTDIWGNTSGPFSASITRDTVVPTNGTLTAVRSGSDVLLVGMGALDANGVSAFKLVWGTSAPASKCATGTEIAVGPRTCSAGQACASFTVRHAMAPTGVAVQYRLCARDAAGNVALGAAASVAR